MSLPEKVIPYMWKHANAARYSPVNRFECSVTRKCSAFFPIRKEHDYCYIALYGDYLVISFMGTDRTITAWAMNFDIYPLRRDQSKCSGIIHDGFYRAWSQFKVDTTDLMNVLKNFTGNIYVTGHSRGGMLAELCGRHLAKNIGIKCSVIAFGAPAPGNKEYRDQFRMLPINGTRVINGYDIVTYVPPYELGFRHGCANRVWLPKPWYHKYIPWLRIKAHYYEDYEKQINRIYKKG